MITVNEYFDLVLLILLGLGLVFELPILIFFLSLFGIVTPKFLWKNFRYAILIIAIVAAIVTPTPDAMTMLISWRPWSGSILWGLPSLPSSRVGASGGWPLRRRRAK